MLEGTWGSAHSAYDQRKLFEVAKSSKATPIADEGIAQIRELYQIEKDICGQSPAGRMTAKQERSEPIIKQMEIRLKDSQASVSAKFPIGEALKYIAKYWGDHIEFLDDGRVELDSNTVERTIRPIALNQKNALFAGHDVGAQN